MAFPWTEAFTGTDGAALPNFTTLVGTWNIQGNAAAPASAAADCQSQYTKTFDNTAYGPDYYVQAKITKSVTANNTTGILARCARTGDTSLSGYLALVRTGTPDQLELWRIDAGVFTQLGADIGTTTWVNGDTLRLEVAGNVLTLKINGVAQGTTRTDSTFQYVSGFAGIRAVSTLLDTRIDDFEVGFLSGIKNLVFSQATPSQTTARIAVGIGEAGTIKVQYNTAATPTGSIITSGLAVTSSSDFTGTFNLTGLSANTTYYYRIQIDDVVKEGGGVGDWRTFKTLQAYGANASTLFAFGSCTKSALHGPSIYTDLTFNSLLGQAPRFYLMLGDDYYVDPSADANLNATGANNTLANKRFYARTHNQKCGSLQNKFEATRGLAVFKMWDDHEIIDDFDDGESNSEFNTAKQAYLEYGGRSNPDPINTGLDPGGFARLYYTFATQYVTFFVCDERSFRSLNSATDNSSKTILGATQKADLKNWLISNKNTYAVKVIVSSTHTGASGQTGNDSWGVGFTTELTEIRDYIVDNAIKGVIFLSADQHWSGYDKVVYRGYNFHDFMASPYAHTNLTAPATNAHLLFSYSAAAAYGLVTIDTTVDPFTLTIVHKNASGTTVNTVSLAETDINWGVNEWPVPSVLIPGSTSLLGVGL